MRVLVAILNWGLGHATRSVPVVEALLARGYEPWLASDGAAARYLKQRFPELPLLELPGYGVRYRFRPLLLDLALQTPRIVRAIAAERHQLGRWVQAYRFQAILSDSRFGCAHPDVPSFMLSHQLRLPIPFWQGGGIANAVNHKLLQQFDECWVPDTARMPGLSGALSHSPPPGLRLRHVGLLSRFQAEARLGAPEWIPDILALLSGPEPARSRLEAQLRTQLPCTGQSWLLVRGVPGNPSIRPCPGNGAVADFLDGSRLAALLQHSPLVLARSGYSSVMDLAVLRKKALLIPTPGQSEQEYLARHLAGQQWYVAQAQNQLNLSLALNQLDQLRPDIPLPVAEPEALQAALDSSGAP